jgi:hypothetical protein
LPKKHDDKDIRAIRQGFAVRLQLLTFTKSSKKKKKKKNEQKITLRMEKNDIINIEQIK